MTSDEIKNDKTDYYTPEIASSVWLKEIAYQLAKMNENATGKAVFEDILRK